MPGEDSWDVVRNLCRAYQASIGIDLCFQYFDEELESLPGCYAEPEGGYWVAWDGGEAVGMVALRRIDCGCEMKRLYVTDAARGTGLGRRLAEHCVDEARAQHLGQAGLRPAAQQKIDNKTKPLGALGTIEELAIKMKVSQTDNTQAKLVIHFGPHMLVAPVEVYVGA